MLSHMEKISPNRIKLRLELDAGAFDEAIQKAYYKLRGRFTVMGFRKGKAPRKLIERVYGENIFYEEAINAVYPDLYEAAIKEHEAEPVDRPEIVDVETDAEKGLVLTVEVYVMPEVTLGQYRGLSVFREDDSVSEDAVDQAVFTAQKRNARKIEVDDRPIQDDDIVTLDFAGTVDGEEFDGGTAEQQQLTIGSGDFVPGFEEQMIGMQIGEEKDLQVRFPDDYYEENLAGKDVVFSVKVHGIRTLELPELDDELAKDLGFDTLDEYKADIRAKLEAKSREAADAAFDTNILEAAAENAEVDIPEPMVERELNAMVNEFAMQVAYQGGINMDIFYQMTGQTEEDFRQSRREAAMARVKGELVLKAIAKAENIEPSQDQIDEVLNRLARDYRTENDEDFRESLTERQMELVRETATTMAVYKLLRDEAQLVEDEEDLEDTTIEEKLSPEEATEEMLSSEEAPEEKLSSEEAPQEKLQPEEIQDEATPPEETPEKKNSSKKATKGEVAEEKAEEASEEAAATPKRRRKTEST